MCNGNDGIIILDYPSLLIGDRMCSESDRKGYDQLALRFREELLKRKSDSGVKVLAYWEV